MVARFAVLVVAVSVGASMMCGPAAGQSKRSKSDDQTEGFVPGAAPYKASRMPYLFGRSRGDAEAQVRAAGLKPKFAGPVRPGATVVTQSVEAGRQLPPGTLVVLRMDVAEGGSITAPSLQGLNHDAAETRAEASGMKPMFYGPNGFGAVVASQSVPPGQQVARGTYIQLQMRAGGAVARVRVPRFVDLSADAARALGQANRLRPVFTGDEGPGAHVVAQSPPDGADAEPNALVQLSLGVAQVRAPNFVGRSRTGAQAVATRSGLTLQITGADDDLARVVRQTPAARSSLPPGSAIAVVMADPATTAPVVPVAGDGGTGAPVQHPTDEPTTSSPAAASASGPSVAAAPAKSTGGGAGKWIAIVGGLGVVAGGVAIVAARRPRRDPVIDDPVDTAQLNKTADKPLPLVTYAASMDAGRPTARFKEELRMAARPLVLTGRDGASS